MCKNLPRYSCFPRFGIARLRVQMRGRATSCSSCFCRAGENCARWLFPKVLLLGRRESTRHWRRRCLILRRRIRAQVPARTRTTAVVPRPLYAAPWPPVRRAARWLCASQRSTRCTRPQPSLAICAPWAARGGRKGEGGGEK